jgi:hypothetical protein
MQWNVFCVMSVKLTHEITAQIDGYTSCFYILLCSYGYTQTGCQSTHYATIYLNGDAHSISMCRPIFAHFLLNWFPSQNNSNRSIGLQKQPVMKIFVLILLDFTHQTKHWEIDIRIITSAEYRQRVQPTCKGVTSCVLNISML